MSLRSTTCIADRHGLSSRYRFDSIDFAAYDLFILRRQNAETQYSYEEIVAARTRFGAMSEPQQIELEQAIIAGLPRAEAAYDRESLRQQLSEYEGITSSDLRANLLLFLQEIAPVAEELGVRVAIHPDDPPWCFFGLPRVVSTAEDVRHILNGVNLPANGLIFCVGSFGAREDNDLLAMIREFAPRIHFAHLRQVTRESRGSFYEADHLASSSDMVGVIRLLLEEESCRRCQSQPNHEIPMRPDHLLADDINKKVNPGYSFVGRL
ncbi:MAG: mannonate dehydratase [Candidatus Acidiferrales bacterium]